MQTEALARQRYCTLGIAAVFHILLALGGAYGTYHLPERDPVEWIVYLFSASTCLLIWWRARVARIAGRQQALERWTMALVLLGAALLLQRMAYALFGGDLHAQGLSLFRPVFAYWPFIYLAAFLLLPSRRAAWLSWTLGAVVALLTVVGLQHQAGFSLSDPEAFSLLLWVLLGNPLFLLMLGALPRYEDWLRVAGSEMQQLRERSELLDRVTASEQRFNLVVDSLQVGVWDYRFGPDGRITDRWWSPRFFELLGYAQEEMMANEDNANLILGSEAQSARLTMLASLKATGSAQFDVRMHTRQRGLRWFNISAAAERDAKGRVIRATGAIEDIHARRMAEIELKEAQAELVGLAYRDALTGLPNRRAFDEQFKREWDRARRSGLPLSLMSIDIDWFKSYNDRYGHPEGDECLRRVAEVITECLRRPGDFAARVGGEEFQVVMPETDAAGALLVAQLLESSLRERAIPHLGSAFGRVTCSIGVATEATVAQSRPESLLSHADRGLYESKRRGRSRVTAASESTPAQTPLGSD